MVIRVEKMFQQEAEYGFPTIRLECAALRILYDRKEGITFQSW
jgi:hypothetical protein